MVINPVAYHTPSLCTLLKIKGQEGAGRISEGVSEAQALQSLHQAPMHMVALMLVEILRPRS